MGFAATETPFRRNGIARFGVFELDLAALKLLRNGREVGLQQQPALLLSELVANAGQLVTREQLKDRIWPSGTYVEFDYGLNTTVNRVRRALRDSASEPRYIETVPKQGYRFIAPVEITRVGVEQAAQPADAEPVPAPPQVPEPGSWRRRRMVIAGSAAALLLVAGAFLTLHFHTKAPVGENGAVVRSYVSLPAGHVPDMVTISPAGDQIVYQASGGGVRRLYRRILGEEESRPIPDSEGGSQPFFSPDGAEVGFYTRTAIRIVGPRGYRDVVAVPAEFTQRKAVWGEDQFLYYTTPREGIWRTPVRGGKAEPVVRPPQEIGAPFYFPQQLLTDPQPRLLYSTNKGPLRRWIEVAQLGGSAQAAGHVVVERAMGGQVLRSGELVYYWQGALMVAPYDSRAGRLAGSPLEAVVNVASNGWYGGDAGVSNNGTLVYVERRLPQRKLVWVDRHGRETVLPIPRAAYEQAEVSPDGTKIAIVRQDRPGHWSLWVYGVRSGEWMRVLDQDVPVPRSVWSPDGKALIAAAAMGEAEFVNLYRISLADPQKPERLTEQSYFGHFPGAWSAAANTVLFTEGVHDRTQSDILALRLGGAQSPRTLVAGPSIDRAPAFSPDGRWFAYSSDTPTGPAVFLQRLDQSSPPREISPDGGSDPAWSTDGRRLFFLNREYALMQVAFDRDGATGPPELLLPTGFSGPRDWWTRTYSVAPDGRFLVSRDVSDDGAKSRLRVVVNWTRDLRRLVPGT